MNQTKSILSILLASMLVGCAGESVVGPAPSVAASSAYETQSSSSTPAYVAPPVVAPPVVEPPVVTAPTPVYASVFYNAGSNSTTGEFFISYTVTNNSTVPIRVSGITYYIYGSQGGMLTDVVPTKNAYGTAWVPVGGSIEGWLEGYSSYVPYGFSFTVSAVGSDGGSNWDEYSGVFEVFLSKKVEGAKQGGPMTHPTPVP